MKELSIEEKAQRYDEAIVRANEMIKDMTNIGGVAKVDDIQYIFPELKESDDERVRKWIRKELESKYVVDNIVNNEMADKALTWLEKQASSCLSHDDKIMIRQLTEYFTTGKGLQNTNDTVVEWLADIKRKLEKQGKNNMGISEATKKKLKDNLNKALEKETPESLNEFLEKQGEQKSVDKIEPKFHRSDWVILTAGELSTTLQIVKVDTNKKLYWFNDSSYLPIVDEECLHLWTIQDAKKGDILQANKCTLIFDSLTRSIDDNIVISSWYFCDTRKFYGMGTSQSDLWAIEGVVPATKEQRDFLFQKIKEVGYEWDAEKKKLKKIIDEEQIKKNLQDNSFRRMFEQKFAWSEEDEIGLGDALWAIQQARTIAKDENDMGNLWYAEKWLKSLRPQNTWKPSDKQIIELHRVISGCSYDIEPLVELETKLKKL